METISSARAIRPEEVVDRRLLSIPGPVIEVFNQLIADSFDGKRAKVDQNTAIEAIQRVTGLERREVFNKSYLDVEPIFQREGWDVEYHKPDHTESFAAYFIFKVKP